MAVIINIFLNPHRTQLKETESQIKEQQMRYEAKIEELQLTIAQVCM